MLSLPGVSSRVWPLLSGIGFVLPGCTSERGARGTVSEGSGVRLRMIRFSRIRVGDHMVSSFGLIDGSSPLWRRRPGITFTLSMLILPL